MIKESVRRFLGPVKSIHSAFTLMEDGAMYISAEQLAVLMAHIHKKKPENLIDFTLGYYCAVRAEKKG